MLRLRTQSRTGFRQESPFVIARVRHRIGGKIGGISIFFQTETTVLEPSQNVFRGYGQSLNQTGAAQGLSSAVAVKLGAICQTSLPCKTVYSVASIFLPAASLTPPALPNLGMLLEKRLGQRCRIDVLFGVRGMPWIIQSECQSQNGQAGIAKKPDPQPGSSPVASEAF